MINISCMNLDNIVLKNYEVLDFQTLFLQIRGLNYLGGPQKKATALVLYIYYIYEVTKQ